MERVADRGDGRAGRLRRAALTGAAMLFAGASLAGCSGAIDNLTGPPVAPSTYPSPAPSSQVAGSPTVPSAFPASIPVVPGLYRLGAPADGAVSLEVTQAPPDAEAAAGKLLTAAGYRPQEVLGLTSYLGPEYVVTVGTDPIGVNRIWYTARPASAVPGVPSIPSFSMPRLF